MSDSLPPDTIPMALRSVAAVLCIVLGLLVVSANWAIVLRYFRTGRPASAFPLVGGVVAALGVMLLPWHKAWPLAFLPIAIDPSGPVMGIVWIFVRRQRGR